MLKLLTSVHRRNSSKLPKLFILQRGFYLIFFFQRTKMNIWPSLLKSQVTPYNLWHVHEGKCFVPYGQCHFCLSRCSCWMSRWIEVWMGGWVGIGGSPPELIKVLGNFPSHMTHVWVRSRGRRESMRKHWLHQKVALQWKGLGESWGRWFKGLRRWSGLRATRQVVRVYGFGPRQWPFYPKSSGCCFLKCASDRKLVQTHSASKSYYCS